MSVLGIVVSGCYESLTECAEKFHELVLRNYKTRKAVLCYQSDGMHAYRSGCMLIEVDCR